MVILETRRLRLRHFELGDLNDLFALYEDPEVIRYIPDAPTNQAETREELTWFLNGHPQHPELGLWAAIEKASNRFVGRGGLLPWTIDGQFEVEVAYAIVRSRWGEGLATEAARAVKAYGFDTLGLTRLVSLIDRKNVASIRVAEKIGMAFEKVGHDDLGSFLLYAVQRSSGSGKARND